MPRVYTVAQMNYYIKNMFRQDFVLSRVEVKGEISNCKYHPSGHIYFTLKDEGGSLAAVMFAGQAKGLSFRLENGMKVVVSGRIDVYERDGKYQLYASGIENDGLGELYKRFEELKKYFEEMGYFSQEYKRPIPKYAQKIGIVTASTGAAIHDIMNISYRRNPYISLVLYPALVQGAAAAGSIVKGIKTLDELGLDVLIVGRGGGSIEDLWAFNEAEVAEAIFNARTPVISAVGHETDFTIADFVADLRAPTPSAAAELAVAEEAKTEAMIEDCMERLNSAMESRISAYRNSLDRFKLRLDFLNPKSMIDERRQRLAQAYDRMSAAVEGIYKAKRHRLELYASRLNGVSPLAKLSQGYSYTEFEDGRQLSDISEIKPKDRINIYIKNGNIKAEVLEVHNGEGDKS